ncbi:hypothetical protein F4778DRAFT_781529 [Xylariomycetidae sp. FL2044]|nr:hypothetical protein F4778DRAFT_781529 [Xylariomycetidae sp. FL2044]
MAWQSVRWQETCLSAEYHDHTIKDFKLHYLGCLKFAERQSFFDKSNHVWELDLLQQQRLGKSRREASEASETTRRSWEKSCNQEIRRILFMRDKLTEDPGERHLVKCLTESRQKWLSHVQQERGFAAPGINPTFWNVDTLTGQAYILEEDVTASTMYFQETDRGLRGVDAERHAAVRGSFPHQNTTLNRLLHERTTSDLLFQSENKKYFHIPYNNMAWAEAAILRHFNESLLPPEAGSSRVGKTQPSNPVNNIIRASYWRNQSREHQQARPYSRRMRPSSSVISSGTGTGDMSEGHVVVLPSDMAARAMPVVSQDVEAARPHFAAFSRVASFGTHVQRLGLLRTSLPVDERGRVHVRNPLGQYLIDAARLFKGLAEYQDQAVIRRYITSDPPLHPRRTLEQGYHWTVNASEKYDKNQVMYRLTKPKDVHVYDPETGTWPEHELSLSSTCEKCIEDSRKTASIVMVDQLWMWILDSNTIITCFPQQYGRGERQSAGVHTNIRTRLENSDGRMGSIFDLGLIIIDECSNGIFNRNLGDQPDLIDAFSAEIGSIRKRQKALFKRFWQWAVKIDYTMLTDSSSADITVPLDLYTEGMLIRELKDIIEELDIMIYNMRTQREILRTFITNAERILDPLNEFRSSTQRTFISRPRKKHVSSTSLDEIMVEEEEKRARQGDSFYRFRSHADESFARVLARIENLEELREAAEAGVDSVRDLLELKGQQISLVQARRSTAQSEEAVKQGRIILVFTLVTIVFLPLSFMSSIFGMNNIEFGSGTWLIRDEVVYMVAISITVILITTSLAFSAWLRALIWYIYEVTVAWFLVTTGLFKLWQDFGIPAAKLHDMGRGQQILC